MERNMHNLECPNMGSYFNKDGFHITNAPLSFYLMHAPTNSHTTLRATQLPLHYKYDCAEPVIRMHLFNSLKLVD